MFRRSFLAALVLTVSPILHAAPAQVELTTSMGPITIELATSEAPATVKNFINYVKSGFYDGVIFHRVINNFMIQGGGFTKEMVRKDVLASVRNESVGGLSNTRGTISMARTSNPHSATSQFFINTVDNFSLNSRVNKPGYTVFGHVSAGMNVVDRISKVSTGRTGQFRDVPLEPVTILSAKVLP